MSDQLATIREDVQRVRSSPYLPAGVIAAGFFYDVTSGRLTEVC
jgi:hypothetical protein